MPFRLGAVAKSGVAALIQINGRVPIDGDTIGRRASPASCHRAISTHEVVALLGARKVDFEYDGKVGPDVAQEPFMRALFSFCRLIQDANVLVTSGAFGVHPDVTPRRCAPASPRASGRRDRR